MGGTNGNRAFPEITFIFERFGEKKSSRSWSRIAVQPDQRVDSFVDVLHNVLSNVIGCWRGPLHPGLDSARIQIPGEGSAIGMQCCTLISDD